MTGNDLKRLVELSEKGKAGIRLSEEEREFILQMMKVMAFTKIRPTFTDKENQDG